MTRESNSRFRTPAEDLDLDAARKAPGLGLVSMRERLRPLGGRLVVESEPLRGTRIHVSVPLEPRVTTDA